MDHFTECFCLHVSHALLKRSNLVLVSVSGGWGALRPANSRLDPGAPRQEPEGRPPSSVREEPGLWRRRQGQQP